MKAKLVLGRFKSEVLNLGAIVPQGALKHLENGSIFWFVWREGGGGVKIRGRWAERKRK